jgi:hypothetical protein
MSDDDAGNLQRIAAQSPQRKVGPWIGEAIRQRLEREGLLPGTPVYNVRELAAQAADVIGADRVIAMLTALGGEKLTSAGSQKEVA